MSNNPTSADVLLTTENLVKEYRGRRVVNGVSVAVGAGEIVGLLGPNGAGKTTTFNMVVGVVKPDEGIVNFQSRKITGLPMHQRARLGIGFLTQETSLFCDLTVEQNILAVLETLKLSLSECEVRLKYFLEYFGLTAVAKSKLGLLSAGEKRRLEFARALVTNPKILLLDEPFAGLDEGSRREVEIIIQRLKGRGVGVLIADYEVRETLRLVDRGYIIYRGQLLVEGNTNFFTNNTN